MITEKYFQGTECSKLNYPPIRGFVDKGMGCSSTGEKVGEVLVLNIPITYQLRDLKTKADYSVFTATSKYTIITDGHLTVEQLYPVYKEAMDKMLGELNQREKLNGLPATRELKPLPLEALRKHLQFWTDQFR